MAAIERLTLAVEEGGGSIAALASRLADRDRELTMLRARREDVEEQAARKGPLPMLRREFLIDAFAEPQLVKHARLIVVRRLEGKRYKEIAKECGLSEYHMENCARIVRSMEDAGLPEPYRRLTEKPDYVPQWCSKRWLKAGHRKGGGKRRKAS